MSKLNFCKVTKFPGACTNIKKGKNKIQRPTNGNAARCAGTIANQLETAVHGCSFDSRLMVTVVLIFYEVSAL